jgi:hypothetical protein
LAILVFVTLVAIIISAVQVAISTGAIQDWCTKQKFSPAQCKYALDLSLAASIISLIMSVCCCVSQYISN